MNGVEIIGYHGTDGNSAKSIISSKRFYISNKKNEWLGEGVYFWDNFELGEWWAKSSYLDKNPTVIKCKLNCNHEEYLDLDKEMNKLEEFREQFIEESKKYGVVIPVFKGYNEQKKFFCTLYSQKNNIKILSFKFPYNEYNSVGFPRVTYRRQLCVTDNENINILSTKGV